MFKSLAIVVVSLFVLVFAALSDAEARIRCNGPYQVQRDGTEFATPYCEDAYIARVALRYGMRVSARTMRHNLNKKEEVCRAIGHDHRIYELCLKYRNDSCGNRRC